MTTIPPVDPALPGLSIAQAARAEPFIVEGDRVRFTGHQTRTGGQVLFRSTSGSAGATAAVRAEGLGHAANLVLYPGVARRDFAGPHGATVETVVAPRSLPFLAWQLSGRELIETTVAVEIATPTSNPDVVPTSSGIVVRSDDLRVDLAIFPDPVAVTVSESEGGLVVTARLGSAESNTVTLASGQGPEVESAIQAARHLGAHALHAARGEEDVLRTHSGVDAVDDGLAWALARTGGLIIERPSAALSLGLAAASMGHRAASARALTQLRTSRPTRAAAGVLAACMTSTSGQVGAAAELANLLLEDVDTFEPDLLRLAATMLAEALHHGAPPETLTALRAIGSGNGSAVRRPGTGKSLALPMLGDGPSASAPVPDLASWLAGLLRGDPEAPFVVHDVRASRARRSAAAFRSDPDRGWADWRALLDEGLAEGVLGPATWDDLVEGPADVEPRSDRPAATAEVLLAFVHGMLGLAPDAPVGRLRIAPRMPTHLTSFTATGIPIGEGTIKMTYERAGGAVRYLLEPERIGVPPLLVFEPSVSGSVGSIRIDGRSAHLDVRRHRGRTLIPVQLPLDDVRALAFEMD